MNPPAALRLSNVGVRRDGRWILRHVSLEVPPGRTFAIVGANGSGKSTLLRVIGGYEFPTEGEVHVLGSRLGETDLAQLRRTVRLVGTPGKADESGQRLDFPPGSSLLDVVLTGSRGHLAVYRPPTRLEERQARRLLKSAEVSGRLLWGAASAGERVRALLARARMPPEAGPGIVTPGGAGLVLLLDEPTAHLDLVAREGAIRALERPPRGTTQVLVTHHIEELPPNTSGAVLLRLGRPVAVGTPIGVLTSRHLSEAFGHPVRVASRRTVGGLRFSARLVGTTGRSR